MPTINVGPGSASDLQSIADCLGKSRKVVIVTGAGISTNCGIPDFRSENGLYSLIQDQYDAALENPPWQDASIFDIDDVPRKKRKPWYYEVVDADGKVVKTIDPEAPAPQQPEKRSLRCSRRTGLTRDITSRHSSPMSENPRHSSLQPQIASGVDVDAKFISHQVSESEAGLYDQQQEYYNNNNQSITSPPVPVLQEIRPAASSSPLSEPPSEILEIFMQTPNYEQAIPAEPSSPLSEPPSEISDISSPFSQSKQEAPAELSSPLSEPPSEILEISRSPTSIASSTTSSRPSSRRGSASLRSNSSSTTPSSTPTPLSPRVRTSQPERRRRTIQRESSSLLSATSGDDLQINSSSQSSGRPNLPNLKGRDLFDSMVWSDAFTTSIFYMFISSLRQKIQNEVTSTTETHKFIRVLRDGGRLVRNYTQNIDSLEEREGLCTDLTRGPGSKARFHSKTQKELQPTDFDPLSAHNKGVEVVLLHGSLVALRCPICTKLSDWDEADRQSATLAGLAPDCPSCTAYNANRTRSGRRGLAVGRLRPDIVLYGEEHPNANLVGPLITHDLALGPDVLLILGTSLKVHGLKVMIREFSKTIHAKGGKVVFVNQTKPPESTWGEFIDYWVQWDCDAWVLDLKKRRPDIWLPQGIQQEEKRRDSTSTPRAPSARPQALRDDKINGVYNTFKILDTLGKLKDADGNLATRPRYFDKPPPRISNVPMTVAECSKKSVKPANSKGKAPQKEKPPPPSTTHRANTGKKRKSYPSAVRDDKRNGAYLATKIWDDLRKLAPSLSVEPPASGRVALSELYKNAAPWFALSPLPPLPHMERMPETPFPMKAASNYLPDIGGLASWPLRSVNLINHPPSGENVCVSYKRSNQSTPGNVRRAIISHTYGTRASRHLSSVFKEGTGVVDQGSGLPVLDTFVVGGNENGDQILALQDDTPPNTSINNATTVLKGGFSPSSSTLGTIVVQDDHEKSLPRTPVSYITTALQESSLSPSLVDTHMVLPSGTPDRRMGGTFTPKSQRIKRMGSIGAILSSPSDEGNTSENSELTVYHDAQE